MYVSNVSVSRTMDGGKHWVTLRGSPGGDTASTGFCKVSATTCSPSAGVPGTGARVDLRDLRVDALHVGTPKEPGERLPEHVHPRVRQEVAADGARVVVAFEEPPDGNGPRLRLRRASPTSSS